MDFTGFDTYTFPSAEERDAFKRGLLESGVTFTLVESEDITDMHRCYVLGTKRTSPTLKSLLAKQADDSEHI